MKIFNSIKWRLQIWYGLILVLVLAGFGITAYQLESGRQMRRVDDELQRRFKVLADALHPRPHGPARPPFNRPQPEPMPEYNPPPAENSFPEKFELPPWATAMFGTNQLDQFYFLIETNDGKEIARGGDVPMLDEMPRSADVNSIPAFRRNSAPPLAQTLRENRMIQDILPSGESILVGCSIIPELKELRRTTWELCGVGGIILIFGLAGGGWLVSRAIRPIENISATAAKISAGDLSQRINVAETESELGKLAAVLNSTFARLESAFAQQKQFASDAAHELRTPVSVILTQTQTALHRKREAEEYRETVEACQRAAQRMKKLISALLELARLDAGQEPMKRQRFDFSKTVADCVEWIKPIAGERGVKIVSELSPLEISGDAERLAQVVTNLLTNAIQYNHDGGEVRLQLKTENGFAILTVADTGAGIAPEDLPRIFERFYRGDKSRTSANNAGLGLAISKAIVAAHSGDIEVTSEEMKGTTFTMRLPLI